jgi:hypothetical protein
MQSFYIVNSKILDYSPDVFTFIYISGLQQYVLSLEGESSNLPSFLKKESEENKAFRLYTVCTLSAA